MSELLGRSVNGQKMKALHEIGRCYTNLASILAMSVFDSEFDDERHALEKALEFSY